MRVWRWIVFVVGLVVTITSGSLYAISVYSPLMKTTMGWNQKQLNLVQTIGDIGLFLGYFIGAVFDKYGPVWTSILSAVLVFTGYIGLYIQFKLPPLSQNASWIISAILFFLVGQGSNGSNCVALTTNMKNFPGKKKALIVGILKAGFTFGSVIVVAVYNAWFDGHIAGFMLMLAFAAGGTQLIGTFGLKVIPKGPKDPGANNKNDSYANPVSKRWLVLKRQEPDETTSLKQSASIIDDGESDYYQPRQDEDEEYEESDSEEEVNIDDEGLAAVYKSHKPAEQEPELDKYGWVLLRKRTFWLLWIAYTIMQGCGLMVLNEVGSLVLSYGSSCGSDPSTLDNVLALSTLLFNLGNCSGRVVGGLFDKWIPTTYMFIGLLLSSGVLNIAYIFADFEFVRYVPFISGLLIGGANTLSVVLTNKFFGMPHFGQNYGLVTVAQGVGGLIFTFTAGAIYDAEANCGLECYGTQCFRYAFMITCLSSFVGAGIATSLVVYLNYKARMQKLAKLRIQ
eukprot:TRINITY_DN5552_c0_g1_i1.p1 TRINITY_DN5552_c0_g1~~TRINITY_DN5552_c0_g1_i1.p1  ORF type:complete len:509 (+),score=90.85 TRINITY_DN5552_c0_g1_i1:238-1764(+)